MLEQQPDVARLLGCLDKKFSVYMSELHRSPCTSADALQTLPSCRDKTLGHSFGQSITSISMCTCQS
jgi:hypothetical protein